MSERKNRKRSIRLIFPLTTLLTSGAGLLLGSVFFLAYDMYSARREKAEEIEAASRLTATNAAAALAFGDAESGGKLLESLRTQDDVRAGALYDAEGRLFATYERADLAGKIAIPGSPGEGQRWSADHLGTTAPVYLDARRVGYLYLESDLRELRERLWFSIRLRTIVVSACLLLVYLLTVIFQRSVTKPIQTLAGVAQAVAKHRIYGLRAPPLKIRELHQLAADFNHMLEELAQRDASLVEARDTLEARVAERTAELEAEVAERKRAETSLRQSEELFRTLSEAAPVGIALIGQDGKISYVNGQYLAMTGLTFEEALNDGWRKAIHPKDLERVARVRDEAIKQGRNYTMNYRYVKRNDQAVWVDTVARAFFDSEGNRRGYVVVIQDVTERQLATERLREAKQAAEAANRAKSEFLANMSHEIRTPMNGILGMMELALDTELSREQREYLEMAHSSAQALLGIINDILDFSKIEAGKMDLEKEPFSLFDCIEGALQPLALRAQQKGLELTWTVERQIPEWLVGDAARLRQVLINLAGNGVKFTSKGEVSVRAEKLGAEDGRTLIRFVVSDTGIGIAPEKHQKIFEAFSQADASTTREYGGTGLGLSISNQLVKLMGGEMGLESREGEGTRFYFTIPFEECTSQKGAQAGEGVEVLREKRVLVVDDHEVNRRLLALLLPQWGLEVELAEDGHEAIRKFEANAKQGNPFPIVLLDSNMPRLGGIETAERIRRLAGRATTAILLLTSSPRLEDAKRAEKLGIARTLSKPIQRAELRQAMAEALAGKSGRKKAGRVIRRRSSGKRLTVLLVEDNAVNQRLAVRLLEKMGHRVVLAANGEEGVEKLVGGNYDVVLMDIQMPVMGGLEATRKIRELEENGGKRTPIVAMTAHALKGDREKYLAAGMDGYVSKPIRSERLYREIQRVTRQPLGPGETQTQREGDTEERAARLDVSDLLGRVENDRELLGELVEIFRGDLPRYLAELEQAVQAGDAQAVARTAHTLKGMLSNLAAVQAAAAAAELEELGKSGKIQEFARAEEEFRDEVAGVLPELEAAVAGEVS